MASEALRGELERELGASGVVGPNDSDAPKLEIPGPLLREVLLALPPDRADVGWLQLRNATITGPFDLSNCHIRSRLSLENCGLEEEVDFIQARAIDLEFIDCEFKRGVTFEQAKVEGNLILAGSKLRGGVSLSGAEIGGWMGMNETKISGTMEGVYSLVADHLKVGADLTIERAHIEGGAKLPDTQIQGEVVLCDTSLAPRGNEPPSTCLMADRMKTAGLRCDRMEATGTVTVLDAEINGLLSIAKATLKGGPDRNGIDVAIQADRIVISGSILGRQAKFTGAVRFPTAHVGGQFGLDKAEIHGEFILLGTTISSEFGLIGAKLDGAGRPALSADRVNVGGGMFCQDLEAKGEVRLLDGVVGGNCNFNGAKLDDEYGRSDPKAALNAAGLSTPGDAGCERAQVRGCLVFNRMKVGGLLSLGEAELLASGRPEIVEMLGAEASELGLRPAQADGLVDLRYSTVRTLWDTTDGERDKLGSLRLEGFAYETLAVPLSAEQRLEWIQPSQESGHYPGVYAELAKAFRRIGHRGDARRVEIESARKAIERIPRGRPRWLWNKFLWVTTGSGYRNWLAGIWLIGLLIAGSLVFWHSQGTFQQLSEPAPHFNPILYAVDATIPVIEVGQQEAYAATGWLRWLSLFLTVSGYALVTAVVAAAAGLLNPGQRT